MSEGGVREDEILRLLQNVGAIRTGHFELSSGRHSSTYVQCALVLQHPHFAEQLGRRLAGEFHDLKVDCVVSPAIGGLIIGHEVGRAMGVRAIFVERDSSGHMALRRGFDISPGETIIAVEDVWTTGGSTCEAIRVVEEHGGRVVAAGAMIDRSGGRLELPVRTEALLTMKMESYSAAECPQCRAGDSAEKPGSRFARKTA